MVLFAHLQENRAQVFAKSQYAFQEGGGQLLNIAEPAMMTDDLRYFGTEFKLFSGCFGCPFANGFGAVHLVMRGIELDAVIMLYIMLQEMGIPGAFRVYFTHPFFSAPIGTAQVYFGMPGGLF